MSEDDVSRMFGLGGSADVGASYWTMSGSSAFSSSKAVKVVSSFGE